MALEIHDDFADREQADDGNDGIKPVIEMERPKCETCGAGAGIQSHTGQEQADHGCQQSLERVHPGDASNGGKGHHIEREIVSRAKVDRGLGQQGRKKRQAQCGEGRPHK